MGAVSDRPRDLRIATASPTVREVCLSVRDSGVGIDPKDADHIFDAFYTTKGESMGIGLAISWSIVEGHEGRLWATPQEGPGAIFSFSIPADP